MTAGRPLKFSTPEELETKANLYISATPEEELTITGLALALDTTRRTLIDYDDRDEFSHTIKRLKTIIEMAYEKSLRKRGNAGDIFGLKNFGWADKFEHAVETSTFIRGDEPKDLYPPQEPVAGSEQPSAV